VKARVCQRGTNPASAKIVVLRVSKGADKWTDADDTCLAKAASVPAVGGVSLWFPDGSPETPHNEYLQRKRAVLQCAFFPTAVLIVEKKSSAAMRIPTPDPGPQRTPISPLVSSPSPYLTPGASAQRASSLGTPDAVQPPEEEQELWRFREVFLNGPLLAAERELLTNLWAKKYPNFALDKVDLVTRNMLLHYGTWRDIGRVTWKADTSEFVHVDDFKCSRESYTDGVRVVRRHADGAVEVVAKCGHKVRRVDKGHGSGAFVGFPTKIPALKGRHDLDVSNLILQEPTGEVPAPKRKTSPSLKELRDRKCWDISFLHHFLMDDNLGLLNGLDDLRTAITNLKDARNAVIHPQDYALTKTFRDKVRGFLNEFLTACVDKYQVFDDSWKQNVLEELTALQSGRYMVCQDLPCRGVQGFLRRSAQGAKTLRSRQAELFDHIIARLNRSTHGERLLIEAPSGSGKTVLCVKIAANFLLESINATSNKYFPAIAPRVPDALLLLSHSAALVQHTVEELKSDVEYCIGPDAKVQCLALQGCLDGQPGCRLYLDHRPEIQVHVMTIDSLSRLVDEPDAARVAGVEMQYSRVVVDEGHLVFSYEPQSRVEGQHRYTDATKVAELVVRVLNDVDKAAIVIFHDTAYKNFHNLPDPVYPRGSMRSEAALHIFRNPGPVRDVARDFCSQYTTWEMVGRDHGKENFFRLINEAETARGWHEAPPVEFVDVPEAFSDEDQFFHHTDRTIRAVEHRAHVDDSNLCGVTRNYGDKIAHALERIRSHEEFERIRHFEESKDGPWARCTAVLVPGMIDPGSADITLADALLSATKEAAERLNFKEVLTALPNNAWEPHASNVLYFGPVENFVGLERPFVLVTGMQHPTYMAYRLEHEHWDEDDCTRVDSRVYLAMTRTTVELTVVEVRCHEFAAHFAFSDVAGKPHGGVPRLIGKPVQHRKSQRPFVEGLATGGDYDAIGTSLSCIEIDPDDLLAALPKAVSYRVRPISPDRLAASDPKQWQDLWQRCYDVHELNLTGTFLPQPTAGEALDRIGLFQLTNLEVLYLAENGLGSVPDDIGKLTSLQQLNLFQNRLETLPDTIGRLENLRVLNLRSNCLSRLPPGIGQLVNLTRMCLPGNCLTCESLPVELGQLKELRILNLSFNRFDRVPESVHELVGLRSLNLAGNCLSKMQGDSADDTPGEFGSLLALRRLDLRANRDLTELPDGCLPIDHMMDFKVLCVSGHTKIATLLENSLKTHDIEIDRTVPVPPAPFVSD